MTKFSDVTTVQDALPKDSYLVEYFRFKQSPKTDRYVGWLIPSGAGSRIELFDVGNDQVVDTTVAKMYEQVSVQSVRQGDTFRDSNTSLSNIRDKLFPDGVWKQMQSRERWIIAPTADLWLVPFSALPLPENSEKLNTDEFRPKEKMKKYYAIENHKITYLISGRELLKDVAAKTKASGDRWSALIAGNPKYDAPPGSTQRPNKRLKGDYLLAEEPDDLQFVGFFRNRRFCRPQYPVCPFPPPPPPPICLFPPPPPLICPSPPPPNPFPYEKGHLLVGELYRSPTLTDKDFTQPGAFLDEDFGPAPGLKYIVQNWQDQLKVSNANVLKENEATAIAFRRKSPSKTPIIAFAGHGFYLDPRGKETSLTEEARKTLLVEHPDPFMRWA